MKKKNGSVLSKSLKKIRRMVAQSNSPLLKMTKEQVIAKLRQTREDLWNEKFAHRSR
jgi:hypothetical protein